jgi:dihydroorotate dehydrogenase
MTGLYPKLVRPILFRLDPENAHQLTIQALRASGALPLLRWFVAELLGTNRLPESPVRTFGLRFPNPVGLAAGYDKDGLAWRGLTALGFGHLEIGTVTPRPQAGNPRPRVFRIPDEKAIINRMGFPGLGADALRKRLQKRDRQRSNVILGINIGKNKDTPNESAVQDYLSLLHTFAPMADYLAVNVSSPNTIGLRRLQARDLLEDLLSQLQAANTRQPESRPILVKIAPDLDNAALDDALGAILDSGMAGIIATNTTTSREELHSGLGKESGGLSGAPLTTHSREMVSQIYRRTGGKLPIIGVGGIMKPEDAKRMLDAGATLVQLYSGLVYAGPGLAVDIVRALTEQECGHHTRQ